jgi:succinate dehydrogenase assembly factor 2
MHTELCEMRDPTDAPLMRKTARLGDGPGGRRAGAPAATRHLHRKRVACHLAASIRMLQLHRPCFSSLRRFLSSAGSAAPPLAPPPQPTQQATQYTPGAELPPHRVAALAARDGAMRAAYDALRTDFSAHSLAPGVAPPPPLEVLRKRLLYRSKQRGWLEVDLLMGAFADAHLGAMGEAELREYERLLNRETLDVYNMVTGKDAPPPELSGPVLEQVKAFVATSPLGKADPQTYETKKGIYSN